MSAPPCMMPWRLFSSSRATSSAVTRSGETWVILMPRNSAKGGCLRAASFMATLQHEKTRARGLRSRPVTRCFGGSALRLRHVPDIGSRRLESLRPDLLRLLVAHRTGNDHVLARLPVRRCRDAMLGGHLQRIEHTQDLVEVAARGHRIDEDQLDLLVGSDDEHVAHRLVVVRRAP